MVTTKIRELKKEYENQWRENFILSVWLGKELRNKKKKSEEYYIAATKAEVYGKILQDLERMI